MSVLVEALSVVVPRLVLDISYPGGTRAYLEAACAPDYSTRHVCADQHLTSVSFLTPDDAAPWADRLADLGIIDVDDNRAVDIVYIDQRYGPTMPCDWIGWRRHEQGFTYCWLAGTTPGDMAAPIDWTPEQSRRLIRTDIRDEPGRMFRLAEEDGIETLLDLQTGRQHASVATPIPETPHDD